jgi:hypothetical protein
MLNTYAGLTVPLIASATATFLFRQFFSPCPTSWSRRRGSTAPDRCASSRTCCCRLGNVDRGAVRHPVHLRLNQYLWPYYDHRRVDVTAVMGIKVWRRRRHNE